MPDGEGQVPDPPPVPLRRWVLFWTIALGGLTFDLSTKALVFRELGEPIGRAQRVLVPNVLELHTSYNTGALWGMLGDWKHASLVFAGLSVVAALAICHHLFVRRAAHDVRLTICLALIMAGALGNCYDRLALGHVRDFVHFHVDAINFDCAIFNFADNMLVAGAVCLVLLALRPERQAAPGPERAAEVEATH